MPAAYDLVHGGRANRAFRRLSWDDAILPYVIALAVLCVYAAGRVFRVGILMQGKGVRLSDLVKWVVRG